MRCSAFRAGPFWLWCGLFWLAGCAPLTLTRLEQPQPAAGPPAVERVVDLGGAAPPASGAFEAASDGRASPGEWLAVLGRNLGPAQRVTIGGRQAPLRGHLQRGLLLRLPRDLAPGRQPVVVETPAGSARGAVGVTRHLVAAAPNGNGLQLLAQGPEHALLDGPTQRFALEWGHRHALDPPGSTLYAIQLPAARTDAASGATRYPAQVLVVDLAATGGPAERGRFRVELAQPPADLALLDARTLLVLAERELVCVDVSRPGDGAVVARLALPARARVGTAAERDSVHTRVIPLTQGWVVALEVYGNRLQLIDLSDPQAPRLGAAVPTAGAVGLPLAVDLARDARDARSVWLLQGPNFRIVGERLSRALQQLEGEVRGLYPPLLGAGPDEPGPAPAAGADAGRLSRLVRYRLVDQRLEPVEGRALPADFFPLFAKSRPDGSLWVSGVNGHVFDFAGVTATAAGLKRVVEVLRDAACFGRILEVPAGGPARTLIQGPALYFAVDELAGSGAVYSVMRLGVRLLPPGLCVDWGVELQDRGFVRLKRLDWEAIIPPYAFALFGLQ